MFEQTGLSVPCRTVPYIGPLDSVRLALDTIEREPYIPLVRYGTVYFASGKSRFGSAREMYGTVREMYGSARGCSIEIM